MSNRKVDWYSWYCEQYEKGSINSGMDKTLYTCPCCGYPSLSTRGGFEVCDICCWEDDGQDSNNAEEILGGPNSDYSLKEARENFDKHFTCYRPDDKDAFEQSSERIERAKMIAIELESYRWKEFTKIDAKLKKVLKLRNNS